jgi:hypothetical protein
MLFFVGALHAQNIELFGVELKYLRLGWRRISFICISCDFGKKLDELPARGPLLVLLKDFGLASANL